jgi:hypothetical protein
MNCSLCKKKEFFMKNVVKIIAIILMVAMAGFTLMSCELCPTCGGTKECEHGKNSSHETVNWETGEGVIERCSGTCKTCHGTGLKS